MIESLIKLDKALFYFINHDLSNPLFDAVLPWLREKLIWIPLYLWLIYEWIRRYKVNGLYLVIILALTVAVSDVISVHVFKPFFHRLRPCQDLTEIRYVTGRISCGSGFSFVSSHASNHFALAVFVTLVMIKRWRWIGWGAFLWAFFIAFSQIYVGVHYPFDVLAGALLGSCIGYGAYSMTPQFIKQQI